MKIVKGIPGKGNSMCRSCEASNPGYVQRAADSRVVGPGRHRGRGVAAHEPGLEPVGRKMCGRGLACVGVGF